MLRLIIALRPGEAGETRRWRLHLAPKLPSRLVSRAWSASRSPRLRSRPGLPPPRRPGLSLPRLLPRFFPSLSLTKLRSNLVFLFANLFLLIVSRPLLRQRFGIRFAGAAQGCAGFQAKETPTAIRQISRGDL